MRILVHNMLMCNVRKCTQNKFPLRIKASSVETVQSEYNPDFVRNMLPKLEWNALVQGCKDLNIQIPETMPDNAASDEEFLRNLHHVLCDIHVQEGALCCPGCAREFPITQGIPNMLLTEDEI